MELEEMAIKFFSLFASNTLLLIHSLKSEQDSHKHMKTVLHKPFGRTAEDAKLTFCSPATEENKTAMQTLARITCLFFFYERIEKEEIRLTYKASLELIIKDMFKEMWPPKFVVTAKSQETEIFGFYFKAHGRKNVHRSRPVSNKPHPVEGDAKDNNDDSVSLHCVESRGCWCYI